jgi:hypothetical protein
MRLSDVSVCFPRGRANYAGWRRSSWVLLQFLIAGPSQHAHNRAASACLFSQFTAARFALETPRDKGPLFKQREEYFGLFKTIAKLPDVCPLDSEAAICRVVITVFANVVLSFSGDVCAVSFPLAGALQLSVDVDARSARVALIDKCKADSAVPEPIGVIRKDDVVLDLGCVRVCKIALILVRPHSISFTSCFIFS